MQIKITDTNTALVFIGLAIVGLCGASLVGWLLISAGMAFKAWRRGEDWRRVWDEQMTEW
jgi:hypothetical protein